MRRLGREEHPQGSRSTSSPAHPCRGCQCPSPFLKLRPCRDQAYLSSEVVITVLPSLRHGTLAGAAIGRRRVWEHGDREGSPGLLPAGHSETPFPGSLYLTIRTHWPSPLPAPCLWSKPVFISGSLGPWFSFGFGRWRVPGKIRGGRRKRLQCLAPWLLSGSGVPELKVAAPDTPLSTQPLPSLGSGDHCLLLSSPFRLRGADRGPSPFLGAA